MTLPHRPAPGQLTAVATLLLLLGAPQAPAEARLLSGVVRDATSGAPLADVEVRVEGLPGAQAARSGADGLFTLQLPDELPPARRLSAVKTGYRPARVTEPGPGATAPLELLLEAQQATDPLFRTVVTSYRSSTGRTPATFSSLDAEQLRQRADGRDLPMLLADQPGVYSTSDAGNGVGYTYLRLRGFDPRRVGVQVNGVPLNDPTEQQIYWVDLPDFASSLQDVQVQRGLGFAGMSHFGGTINLLTAGAGAERQMRASYGAGSFGTERLALQLGSGLVDQRYQVFGRFSRVRSDGYRRGTGAELWGYFLTATRQAPDWSVSVTTFGGQERTHQAFNGIPQSYLDDGRRRLNLNDYYAAPDSPANTYPDNLDVFSQPHYQLAAEWRPAPTLTLRSTLYGVAGDGYYENYKAGESLVDFGFADATAAPDGEALESDLIRRKRVDKLELGWLGQVAWQPGRLGLTLGWNVDEFRSDHDGRVLWVAAPPSAQASWPRDYYGYDEDKTSGALYLDAEYRFGGGLRLLTELQGRYAEFRFAQRAAGNFGPEQRYSFDDQYWLLNPKAGLLYDLLRRDETGPGPGAERPPEGTLRQAELYLLAGRSTREPAADDYWDAYAGPDDLGARPLFRSFTRQGDHLQASDPTIEPESLIDVELGSRWSWRPGLPGLRQLQATMALYWMDFHNEIVDFGGVDDDGNPIKGNVERTVHRGLEASLAVTPLTGLRLAGNLSVSDDQAEELVQRSWDAAGEVVELDRAGNPLPNFPGVLGHLSLAYTLGPATVELGGQYVGRRYLDLSGAQARSIAPYWLLDGQARLEWRQLAGLERVEASLQLRNLLDRRYETHGWFDEWYGDGGERILFPGAPRSAFFSLGVGL